MSNSQKAKNEEKAAEGSLEAVFDILEKKAESLSQALRDLQAANERLAASVSQGKAERDRLEVQLKEARAAAARQGELAEAVARHEAEKGQVRARIERLIKSLEESGRA